MMLNKISSLVVSILLLISIHSISQSVAINNDGAAPHPSAMLDVKSTGKGLLIPRMSSSDRISISSPAAGLLVYDTDLKDYWYYNGSTWTNMSNGWKLGGNALTVAGTHFLGTTDNVPLEFRIRNVRSGLIDSFTTQTALGFKSLFNITTGAGNTAMGYNSLRAITTGSSNTAIGTSALNNNVTGNENTALGYQALYANTTGGNTGVGYRALFLNTIGSSNTALGFESMLLNSTGTNNTAVGWKSLNLNSTGSNNTAVGMETLSVNSGGTSNTAIGYKTLNKNTSGVSNTGLGFLALFTNRAGNYNVAVGHSALVLNEDGHNNVAVGADASYTNIDGSDNVAIGYSSLVSNQAGSRNVSIGKNAMYANTAWNGVAIGYQALRYNTSGDFNTAVGGESLFNNQTGIYNTAIGGSSLYSNTTGSYNTGLGINAGKFLPATTSNVTCVGYDAGFGTTSSNQVNIGNKSVSWIGGQTGWFTYSSDARIKRNVQENVPGLAFITKLKPVTYNLDIHTQDRIMNPNKPASEKEEEWEGKYDIEKMSISGFLAQEVETAANELGYDFSGVYKPKNGGLYGLQYSAFVMPLVKAVQELSTENTTLKTRLDAQEQAMKQLNETVKQLSAKLSQQSR